jgi:hypothetical protein
MRREVQSFNYNKLCSINDAVVLFTAIKKISPCVKITLSTDRDYSSNECYVCIEYKPEYNTKYIDENDQPMNSKKYEALTKRLVERDIDWLKCFSYPFPEWVNEILVNSVKNVFEKTE